MQSLAKSCLLAAALTALASTASANIINLHIGAAATKIGPNLTEFDNLISLGGDLSADLVPGVLQTLTFYPLNFIPTCDAAVCNGIFTRGLNFGFVSAEDLTIPGSASSPYDQPVKDSIGNANNTNSSHTLSISSGGGLVLDLSSSERLTITVPAQIFPPVATGDISQSDSVSASFLLSAASVPEPSASLIMLAVMVIAALAMKRLYPS